MRTIRLLHQSMDALVDDDDFEFLLHWEWRYLNGYVSAWCRDTSSTLYIHRVILIRAGFDLTNLEGEHRDRDRLNNQKYNLRVATSSQNKINMALHTRNVSGFKGVYFNRQHMKWQAQISFQSKRRYLGLFESAEEAAKAYDRAAKRLFGEFAFLNFPIEK